MATKLCSLFTLLFLLLQSPFSALADRQLIENTCKATPSYDLCLSTLLPDPDSLNANVSGLAIIMVKAVGKKSDQILSQIQSLIGSRPDLKDSLNDCKTRYNAVVKADVPVALRALDQGVPKFADDGMADAVIEAQACESGFRGRGQGSPLTAKNQATQDLSNVARGIIKILLLLVKH